MNVQIVDNSEKSDTEYLSLSPRSVELISEAAQRTGNTEEEIAVLCLEYGLKKMITERELPQTQLPQTQQLNHVGSEPIQNNINQKNSNQ